MKIYTKTGDDGTTGLLGGTRVAKYDLRIEAYGTVDELNSHVGLLGTLQGTEPEETTLKQVQDRLFALGASLATDDAHSRVYRPDLHPDDTLALEAQMDAWETTLPPLKNFVLPGGCAANAHAHLCRTVCRRAERRVVELKETAWVQEEVLLYLNRLSDWFFMYSRVLSQRLGAPEVAWVPRPPKAEKS